MKKIIALCLALVLMMGMTIQANAATDGDLYACTITISCQSNGVGIDIQTHTTAKADEIGCKNIVLIEKNGSSSKEISIPAGSKSNSDEYGGSYTYTGAVKGRTYSVSGTHYATFGNTTKTAKNSTGEMVYN